MEAQESTALHGVSSSNTEISVQTPPSPTLTAVRRSSQPVSSADEVTDAAREGETLPNTSIEDDIETVDLHCLDYISAVDSHLICPICHNPFVTPVQLECEHSFCQQCLDISYQTAAPGTMRRCPMCRRPGGQTSPNAQPRYITQLLDGLKVQCPNRRQGCVVELERSGIQSHVAQYCDYTLLRCAKDGCGKKVARKDAGKDCLHVGAECSYCHTTIMQVDLQQHLLEECSAYTQQCQFCEEQVRKKLLPEHIRDVCPDAISTCPGSEYGCDFSGKRAQVELHTTTCTMAKMAPFLEKQNRQFEQLRITHEATQRRMQIFEGSLKAVQDILYSSPADVATPQSLSTTSGIIPEVANPAIDRSVATASEPPFETPIQHVLSLHEALREELSRLENTIADHDARHSMMFFNESQRHRDETAHTNAAISTMRAQLHWLMSSRLQFQQQQQQQQQPTLRGVAGPATGSVGSEAGSVTRAISASGSGGPGPIRRMSGQDTKL